MYYFAYAFFLVLVVLGQYWAIVPATITVYFSIQRALTMKVFYKYPFTQDTVTSLEELKVLLIENTRVVLNTDDIDTVYYVLRLLPELPGTVIKVNTTSYQVKKEWRDGLRDYHDGGGF